MHILLDENISYKIASILEIIYEGVHTASTMDAFGLCGFADTDWVAAVAKMDSPPIVFTYDLAMRKNQNEVKSLRDSGLTVFMFKGCGHISLPEQAWRIIRIMPLLEQNLAEHPGHIMDVDSDKEKILVKI